MRIELIDVRGFIPAIWGMRLSMQSEEDSSYLTNIGVAERVGPKDKALMLKLVKAGDFCSAFMRMIQVWVRLKASRMWWRQWDKYKFQHFMYDVEEQSTNIMHIIADDELEFAEWTPKDVIDSTIDKQTVYRVRKKMIGDEKEEAFFRLEYSLPEGLLQERIVNLNYQTLRIIYQDRQNHRLPEWKELYEWIKTLPHSEIIMEARK